MMYSGILGAAVTLLLYFGPIPPYHELGRSGRLVHFVPRNDHHRRRVLQGRVTKIRLRDTLVPTRADLRNYVEAMAALRAHLRSRRLGREAA